MPDARTIKDKEFLIQCESVSMKIPQQGDLAIKVLSLCNDEYNQVYTYYTCTVMLYHSVGMIM